MNIDGHGIFAPDTPVLALPSWYAPRVLLPKSGGPIRRWRESAFYPATRSSARFYRFALRGKAALGWSEARQAVGDRWTLREFVGDCLPATASVVLQIRPSGPRQKYTMELRDHVGTIIGYVKYARETWTRRRLEQEHAMLTCLPAGVGPSPLKFGDFGDGTALLVTPLAGRAPAAKLPPVPGVLEFVKSLEVSAPLALASHPYLRAIRERAGGWLDTILEDLAGKSWPVSLQHGDFVPWNLRRSQNGKGLSAFDWEYGIAEGFPYLDLAHFILQIAVLIYSWPPLKSAIYAARWLEAQPALGLTPRETRALVRLAMFDTYLHEEEGGHPDNDPFQAWRRKIWRGLW